MLTNYFSMGTVPSYLIECSNCGHCSDLSGCPQAPSHIEGTSNIPVFAEASLEDSTAGKM